MCLVKKPKPITVSKDEKDLPILRNPFLDGIDPILRARSTGMRSLRIDRGVAPQPAAGTASPLLVSRPIVPMIPAPNLTIAR